MNTLYTACWITLGVIILPPLLIAFGYFWWTGLIVLSFALAHKFAAYVRPELPVVPFCWCYHCQSSLSGPYKKLP